MGLFSRKTTVYVSSVIYQLGDELDKIPDIIKASVIGSKMRGESTTPSIKQAIIDGQGVKLQQAFSYARDQFWAGLPLGLTQVSNTADSEVVEALTQEWLTAAYAPTAVVLKSVVLDWDNNHQTILHQQIETKYNYDFYEEEVFTSVFGIPVGSTLALQALPNDPILHEQDYGWRLVFTKPDTTLVTFDEWYPRTLFDEEDDVVKQRLFIEASFAGAPATTLMYAEGGTDNQLNLLLRNSATKTSGTFPGLVLKSDNRWIDHYKFYSSLPMTEAEWKATDKWKTSKGYARRLGVDMAGLIKAVKENPDEGEIDYMFVQPGTIISSPNQCAMEYHFNYFNRLRLSLPDGKPALDAWIATTNELMNKPSANACPAQSVRIKDLDTETNCVNMEIGWRYMIYEEKTGTLAKPYEQEVTRDANSLLTVKYWRPKLRPGEITYDFTKLIIRKRLTENTYAELTIVGLWHENYVYQGKSVQSGVWDAFNDKDGDFGTGFIIPLEIETFATLSGRERLQLAQEALHIIFNSYQVVKQKWYQTGIFAVFMLIISVVIIVITWGTATPYVTALNVAIKAALITIGISATIAAALALVLTALVVVSVLAAVQLVAKEAGEWAEEHWGSFWGAVVQVIVTFALSYAALGMAGTVLDIQMTAMTLIQQIMIASSLIFSTLATYTQLEMEKIQEEMSLWNLGADQRQEQIKQLEQLWEEHFPEMSLPAQMWFAPIERMDDWLQRTQSTGDALVNRLIAPIEYLSELTLTPRLQ